MKLTLALPLALVALGTAKVLPKDVKTDNTTTISLAHHKNGTATAVDAPTPLATHAVMLEALNAYLGDDDDASHLHHHQHQHHDEEAGGPTHGRDDVLLSAKGSLGRESVAPTPSGRPRMPPIPKFAILQDRPLSCFRRTARLKAPNGTTLTMIQGRVHVVPILPGMPLGLVHSCFTQAVLRFTNCTLWDSGCICNVSRRARIYMSVFAQSCYGFGAEISNNWSLASTVFQNLCTQPQDD